MCVVLSLLHAYPETVARAEAKAEVIAVATAVATAVLEA